ncbi:unnamed protein product [Pieris brassicae]|uniref:Gustatory receptor n=1 Tax=Pieris brassicae TaxID=7116 RepID=A0A9P0SY81_PIEBR|nr:unnamed protein product [Pieris brassicae]
MATDGSCVVNGSFLFILRVSRVFGLAPISFKPVEDGCRIELLKSSYYEYVFLGMIMTVDFFLGVFFQFMLTVIELNVSFIKLELHKYLETIKIELAAITADMKSDMKTKPQMSDIMISLRALSKAFVTICNICFKYNDSENLLALALSSSCTLNLIRTIYNFSRACTATDVDHKSFQIFLEFSSLVLHLFRIVLYVDSSSVINKEVDKIRYQLAKLSQLVTSVGMITPLEADIFQFMVIINNPVLNPMGFFTVSRGLIGPLMLTVIELNVCFTKFELHKYLETIKIELAAIIADMKSDKKTKPQMSDIMIFLRALSKAFVTVDEIRYQIAKLSQLVTSVGKIMPLEAEIFQSIVIVNNPVLIPMGFFTLSRGLIGPLMLTVIELNVCFIKLELHKYLETIKIELAAIIADMKSDKKTKPQMSDILISLRALSKAFVTVCNICYKYYGSDNLQAVALSSTCTINLIRTLYNFSEACTATDIQIYYIFVELGWLLFHLFRVILYVDASSEISKEVDEIRYQIAKLSQLVTSVGKIMPLDAEIFQSVVIINNPVLIPMGFFTVSRGLIGPILSTVITYGIVSVQIG